MNEDSFDLRSTPRFLLTAKHCMRYPPTMQETLEKLQRELSEGVGDLSSHDTQTRRAPDRWTIQQTVEHLTLTYAATYDAVAMRVAKGTPTKGSPTLAQRMGQFAIATCGLFPPGRVAPPVVTPREPSADGLAGAELAESIRSSLLRMDKALTAAEGLFGPTRRSISHIILGPMSVSQWRRFHLAHGRHHLKQILSSRKMIAAGTSD